MVLVAVIAALAVAVQARHERSLERSQAELRAAERAARTSEGQLRDVLENVGLIAVILDAHGGVIFANDSLLSLTGWRRDAVLGRDWFETFLPAEIREESRRGFDEAIAAGTILPHHENEISTRAGERRLIAWSNTTLRDPEGAVAGTAAIGEDITDRRAVEQALRQSEERYRTLCEQAADGILITDPDLRIRDANAVACAMFGYTRDEILDLRATDLFPTDELAARPPRLAELRAGKATLTERILKRRDGTTVRVEVSAKMLPDGRFLAIARDVSEKARLEEQVRQAQRMESIGRLAGGIAHDFNNLLMAISGFSELVLADLPPGDPHRDNLGEVVRAAERASGLTRQLLAFSRRQVLRPQVLDLNALIDEIQPLLRRTIREDVELVTVGARALGVVRADPSQLEQVLLNLAVNARDAMPEGGRLTIETADVKLDEAYAAAHAELTPGHYVMLAVSDSGIGMDAATQAHIFEPFFTTKEEGKGTGLGLSTVYGIVKQSGGHIWVYSEPGRGSTFKIYLPRVDEAAQPLGQREAAAPAAPGSETILVAEDDAAVRALVGTVLERRGYRVLTAASGDEALELAASHDGPLDLLLSDLVMPGMSGRDLAARLSASRPTLRVLFVSGYAPNAVAHHGAPDPEDGAYLAKPITGDALARKVREVLDAAPRGG